MATGSTCVDGVDADISHLVVILQPVGGLAQQWWMMTFPSSVHWEDWWFLIGIPIPLMTFQLLKTLENLIHVLEVDGRHVDARLRFPESD